MSEAKLGCIVVAVEGVAMGSSKPEASILLPNPDSTPNFKSFFILHVQSPPSIVIGVNPGAIPFGGPNLDLDVPAFAAAIESHQKRISQAILDHALKVCSQYKLDVKTHVVVGDAKEKKICEVVENLHADLLLMGSLAFGPIKRHKLASDET